MSAIRTFASFVVADLASEAGCAGGGVLIAEVAKLRGFALHPAKRPVISVEDIAARSRDGLRQVFAAIGIRLIHP